MAATGGWPLRPNQMLKLESEVRGRTEVSEGCEVVHHSAK